MDRIKITTPGQFIESLYAKTRCPECGGMLVYSMKGTICNKCGWIPEKKKE